MTDVTMTVSIDEALAMLNEDADRLAASNADLRSQLRRQQEQHRLTVAGMQETIDDLQMQLGRLTVKYQAAMKEKRELQQRVGAYKAGAG